MATYSEMNRTFVAGEDLLAFRQVKLSSGEVVYADAGEAGIGYASTAVNDGQPVNVNLLRPTVKVTAAGAITAGAAVYAAADGKVSASANGNALGLALQAAGADNDVIEVLPYVANFATPAQSTVETKTANYTVLAGDSGKTFNTTAAAGSVTFAMPAAVAGLKFRFRVGAAQELRIDPNGTETISLPSTGVAGAAGKYLVADAIGETVDIECVVAGTWNVFGFTGTWTAEP